MRSSYSFQFDLSIIFPSSRRDDGFECNRPQRLTYSLLTPVVKCTDVHIIPFDDLCSTDATGVMLLAYVDICSPDQSADDRVMAVAQHNVNGTSPSTAAT